MPFTTAQTQLLAIRRCRQLRVVEIDPIKGLHLLSVELLEPSFGSHSLANFFLIDQSLCRPGGHHADYACCIARAANEMGFSTTIGSNVELGLSDELESLGRLKRVYRKTIYQRESYLAGLRHLTRAKPNPAFLTQGLERRSLLKRAYRFWRLQRHKSRRESLIRSFAIDCQKLFRENVFTESDHVFLTAVSEIELMGLAAFLANQPRTLQVQWHLQFHFNLFEGRTPEYSQQLTTARLVQSCFDAALARIPYHAMHFYTTSETLAEQYNRLGVGEFESLPYPVSPHFRSDFNQQIFSMQKAKIGQDAETGEANSDVEARPINITCPGELRREKGFVEYLQPLVNKVWDSHLKTGNVKFVVQRPARKRFEKQKLDIKLPPEKPSFLEAVKFMPHPLPDDDYINLLRSSDCGMLFYDSRVYFSRRAGVLGELLSCGKPVIVPAGSWLSDQIQPSIQRHADQVVDESEVLRELGLAQLNCDKRNVPLPGGIFSFDDRRHPFLINFQPEKNETAFAIDFHWHWPENSGVYCRVDVVETNENGGSKAQTQVVGRLRDSARTSIVFNVAPETVSVQISFRNAFHDSNASLRRLNLTTLNHPDSSLPVGGVGIVAADEEHLADSINELVKHYAHYRSTAEAFAQKWYLSHEPKRTIARLLSNNTAFARSA